MLVDSGTIRVHDDRWSLDETRDQWAVPDTLAGVLQARTHSLPPEELAAAQRAAIIGHLFWSEGIAALGGSEAAIGGLVARGLVVHQPVSSVPRVARARLPTPSPAPVCLRLVAQVGPAQLPRGDRCVAGVRRRRARRPPRHHRGAPRAGRIGGRRRVVVRSRRRGHGTRRDAGRTVVELTAQGASCFVDQADAHHALADRLAARAGPGHRRRARPAPGRSRRAGSTRRRGSTVTTSTPTPRAGPAGRIAQRSR